MSRAIRITAVTVMAMAATGVALAGMSPAQADTFHCTSYLSGAGYAITDDIGSSCSIGASDQAGAYFYCRDGLIDAHVSMTHAAAACDRADW